MVNVDNIKIAAATPVVHLACPAANADEIIRLCREASENGAEIVAFPELAITGCTCASLFNQEALLFSVWKELKRIETELQSVPITAVIGTPIPYKGGVSSGAVIVRNGKIVDEDERFIVACGDILSSYDIEWPEDVRLIINPTSEPERVTTPQWISARLAELSARLDATVVHCAAGYGESTGDNVYAGGTSIYAGGECLAGSDRFNLESTVIYANVPTQTDDSSIDNEDDPDFTPDPHDPHPFVPESAGELARRCEEILNIQTTGLITRMAHIGCRKVVVGVSGGLDSTLALLVCARAFDRMGLDRKGIIAISMPGFGTSSRTHSNAGSLMESLGADSREISIEKAVLQHFEDIAQPKGVYDAAYENAQARERTQILMDVANQCGGIVIGTGDLSELALGWCTYNGDQMSMYGVNAGVPKTLIPALVSHIAEAYYPETLGLVRDVIDTPISPELKPANEDGTIAQKTEDSVGPYELHDYFLYWTVRHGKEPKRLLEMASEAFKGVYDVSVIEKWLRVFLRRFFSQQFKRSALPDGPAIGSVSLSPRSGYLIPSDVSSKTWLDNLDSSMV